MTVKYQDYLIRDFISDSTGTKAVNVPITILISGTNILADLFDDNGVQKNNPVITDNEGYYSFNINAGSYDFIADYDQPEDNQDVIYKGKLIFSSTDAPNSKQPLITLNQLKTGDYNAGDKFIVADRGFGTFEAVVKGEITPNEIDIIESDVNPNIVYFYVPIDGISLMALGAAGDFDRATKTGTDDDAVFARAMQIIKDLELDGASSYIKIDRDHLVSTTHIAPKEGFKLVGTGQVYSGIFKMTDGHFMQYENGLLISDCTIGGPAYFNSASDYLNADPLLFGNGYGFTTLDGTTGGEGAQAAFNVFRNVRVWGFKIGIYERVGIWNIYDNVFTRNLAGIVQGRNNSPDDKSNPDSPGGWNNFTTPGWFHNVMRVDSALFEDREVGYMGCPVTINFNCVTVQRQVGDGSQNRVLPDGEPGIGVWLYSGIQGLRQAFTAKFTEFYAEACKQPLKFDDRIEVEVDGAFFQGYTAENPYEAPIISSNSEVRVTRCRGQSWFRTHAILSGGAVLYGDTGAVTTEGNDAIDLDATSKWYRTASNLEKHTGTYVASKANGEANKQFVFREHPFKINSAYDVSVFMIYDGLESQSTAATYKVIFYNTATEPVISLVSLDNLGGASASVQDFYSLDVELEDTTRYLKIVTQDPSTNQMAFRVVINQASAIPTLEKTVTKEDVTSSESVRRSSGVGDGGGGTWKTVGVRSVNSNSTNLQITPASKQRVVVTSFYSQALDGSNITNAVLSGARSGNVLPSANSCADPIFNTSSGSNYIRVGSNTAYASGNGVGESGYLYFSMDETVTVSGNGAQYHIDYQLQEQA